MTSLKQTTVVFFLFFFFYAKQLIIPAKTPSIYIISCSGSQAPSIPRQTILWSKLQTCWSFCRRLISQFLIVNNSLFIKLLKHNIWCIGNSIDSTLNFQSQSVCRRKTPSINNNNNNNKKKQIHMLMTQIKRML